MTRGHQPAAGADFLPPPPTTAQPMPKRLYNIVDPAALARVYAASLVATSTARPDVMPEEHRNSAELAVIGFVHLMRRTIDG